MGIRGVRACGGGSNEVVAPRESAALLLTRAEQLDDAADDAETEAAQAARKAKRLNARAQRIRNQAELAEGVQLASLLALIVGAIRLAIGLLRAGQIVYLMSEPVMRGFMAGAAVLIVLSQLPDVLGLGTPPTP